MSKFRKQSIPRAMAALLLTVLVVSPALALDPNQAVYIGGSAAIVTDTLGTLDTASSTALIFHFKQPDGSAGQLAIDYSGIHTVSARNEVTHHLGVAPAIAVGLLAARQRRYFITLTWTDQAGVAQAAEIEVSRREQQPLVTLITDAPTMRAVRTTVLAAIRDSEAALNEGNFTGMGIRPETG